MKGHHPDVQEKGPAADGLNPDAAERHSRASTVGFSTVIMMVGLLLGKLTGQLREILIVPVFGGVGAITDAYIIGFQVPDLLFQLLVGGAIQAALTPFLAGALERRDEQKAWHSLSVFISYAVLVMAGAAVAGILLAPWLVPLLNVGKPALTISLAVRVTQVLFPQMILMMLAALCIGILNAYRRFAATAFGPGIYNICVIAAMIALGSATAAGAVRTAAGVTAAALAFSLLQLRLARRQLRSFHFSFDHQDTGFRKLLHRAVPTLLAGAFVPVNTIILNGFAFQFAGAATMLRQASTTWQLPYGVFAVAIGNVMLPNLSRHFAAGDDIAARRLLTESLRRALFLVMPVAVLFFCLPQETIAAIFQWGASYTDVQTATTAGILRFYCFAMLTQTVVFLLNQAFYARGQTRIALLNGIFTLIFNTMLGYALTRATGIGVASLSLAYALTSCFSAWFLLRVYWLSWPTAMPTGLGSFLSRILACALALATAVLTLRLLPVDPTGKFLRLAWYLLRCLTGLAAYALTAFVLRLPEIRLLTDRLGRLLIPDRTKGS